MTANTHPYAGRFVWYDLMTTDQPAAQKFYTAIAGWGTDEWDMGGTPYRMWTVNGTSIGGMMQLPAEQAANKVPPHWLGYVGTPDVEATVAKATSLGATILVPPTPIPTVGRFAILSDPQQATFAVFTPEGDSPGRAGEPAPDNFGGRSRARHAPLGDRRSHVANAWRQRSLRDTTGGVAPLTRMRFEQCGRREGTGGEE